MTRGERIAVDSYGNSFTLGYWEEYIDFDPGVGVDERYAMCGPGGAFMLKLLPNGYWD